MASDRIVPPAEIAFVGTGKMGAPMAARLVAAGFQVRVFDLSAPAVERFCRDHPAARPASSAREAAAGARLAITMLPDGGSVRQAAVEGGLAAAMGRGGLLVDMSSSSPVDTLRLGEDLAAAGVSLVDAPVSGGVRRAVDGSLAIMAGGDPAQVARCRPALEAMGKAVYETGPLGSGHAMKALNNFVSAAGLVAMCEALLVGRRFGLDPSLMVDVLNASTGRNNSTEVKAKQHILSGTFGSGFSIGLMVKDLRTAAELAGHLGVPAPTSRAISELWGRASGALGPDADHTEIYRFLESLEDGRG